MQINVSYQSIDERGISVGPRILVYKLRTLHKCQHVCLLRLFEVWTFDDLRTISGKLGIVWLATQPTFERTINKRSCSLELQLDKEGRGDSDPATNQTSLICSAVIEIARPEIEASEIRLAVEQITVLLADKEEIMDQGVNYVNRNVNNHECTGHMY